MHDTTNKFWNKIVNMVTKMIKKQNIIMTLLYHGLKIKKKLLSEFSLNMGTFDPPHIGALFL